MKNSVIGLGKLGLPFALFLASKNQHVTCCDSNKKIIRDLSNKISPYIEPLTSKYLKIYSKKITLENNYDNLIKNSQITHLVLPTPSLIDNSFSNEYLLECLDKLSKSLLKYKNKSHIINITSTVMPGSCQEVFRIFLESKGLKNEKDFIITYNPHFIAQGTTIKNLENPDFILIGSDSKKGKKLVSFYKKIYKNKVKISLLRTKEAEIVKISINSYITTKITFSNFISEVCENTKNVDASLVLNAIGRDHRIGNSYLGVGTKYSGPCFPRDNKALHYFTKDKIKNSLPKFIDKINNSQTKRITRMLKKIISKERLKKFTIGIFGLTYKDKTSIIDDSQSYDLIIDIRKKYKANINTHDDNVEPNTQFLNKNKLIFFKNIKKFIQKSKILILMYPSKKFIKSALNSKNKIIIDCWNVIDEKKTNSKVYKLGKYL
jgi:UDPglucose 6-dehydrogenase